MAHSRRVVVPLKSEARHNSHYDLLVHDRPKMFSEPLVSATSVIPFSDTRSAAGEPMLMRSIYALLAEVTEVLAAARIAVLAVQTRSLWHSP